MAHDARWIANTRVVKDYLQAPSFRRALDGSDKAKLQVEVRRYKSLSEGEVADLSYQRRATSDACREASGLWSCELWTGGGKSYIAAFISLEFLKRGGKTIFICPNKMGLGTIKDGILNKFFRVFEKETPDKYGLGGVNETDLLQHVFFFTPETFVGLRRYSRKLFERILGDANLLIVDEAHHFPEDDQEQLVVYGQIWRIAKTYFLLRKKKVVTLTATHGRTDGKLVVGKERPDFQVTVYDAVQEGWCPEIHGIRVQLKTRAPKAVRRGDFYDLRLHGRQLGDYIREVVGVMVKVQERNIDSQFCVFVRTKKEAHFLSDVWNHEAGRRDWKPVAILTGDVPMGERARIREDIKNRAFAGYVTCQVGSESIDIPQLEIVHLVRRTRSIIKLVQSVGRALRLDKGKRRVLVMDYCLAEARLIRACMGLEEYATHVGLKRGRGKKKIVNGGPLIVIEGTKNAKFEGVTLSDEKEWVLRRIISSLPKRTKWKVGDRINGRWTLISFEGMGIWTAKCGICGRVQHATPDYLGGLDEACNCGKYDDITGQSFGSWKVIGYLGKGRWKSKCACGSKRIRSRSVLKRGGACWACRLRAISKYHNLKPGDILGILPFVRKSRKPYCGVFKCRCGKDFITTLSAAAAKKTTTCGCRRRFDESEYIGKQHGEYTVTGPVITIRIRAVCKCGAPKLLRISDVRRGNGPKSCLKCSGLKRRKELPIGKRFGKLVTVRRSRKRGQAILCKCDCGRNKIVNYQNLVHGSVSSCGCGRRTIQINPGTKFGRLTIIREARGKIRKGCGVRRRFKCKCACGRICFVQLDGLRHEGTKSCGCLVHDPWLYRKDSPRRLGKRGTL